VTVARLAFIAALLGIAALAEGCSGSPSSAPSLPASALQTLERSARPDTCAVPQTEDISSTGGTLTLPTCGGYAGNITYGKNDAPKDTTVKLITTLNNPGGVPVPRKGTVLAYLQATGHSDAGSVTFKKASKKSTITNSALKPGDTYFLYAYAFGFSVSGFPKNIGSPSNGVLTFTSPVNGQTIPVDITVDFELVDG
jgi:hypothetical protein